ncbi:MAG: MerR family transcriptional regulator [Nevskia sp.]|nr:MerR family transcriptional regulator [Nevskia sp.]
MPAHRPAAPAAPESFTIGRLAKAAEVNIDTVRFYERQGLLQPAPRSAGGYRLYRTADLQRLQFIRRAKTLGFSLDDIAELLRLTEDGHDRGRIKAVAQRRVADLEARIAELSRMRSVLAHHAGHCSGHGEVRGCPIIEALLDPGADSAQSVSGA